jgi:hypothetical protein
VSKSHKCHDMSKSIAGKRKLNLVFKTTRWSGRETPPLFLIADIRLLSTLAVALAEGFEEDYASGYAYVEGFYGAGGGERHEEVAAFAG